jgi:hypothetical protein
MQFLLQVRFDGAQTALAQLPAPEREAVFDEYRALALQPGVVGGKQLREPGTAITVQVDDGRTVTTDGPPTTGAIDGYYLFDGELEGALALAARIPAARMGGSVEVRPLVEG